MSDSPQQFTLVTPDGLMLKGRKWIPNDHLHGIVCLIHGLGEHCGRYQRPVLALTGAGYGVISMDLRGHGISDGIRGHTPSYETLMDDIQSLVTMAVAQFPALPLVLYGHSLGGNLVLNFALRRTIPLQGVIATSPWLQLSFAPPVWQMQLARLLNKVWPSLSQSNRLDGTWLSHDPEEARAHQYDPLVHARISVRMFHSVQNAGQWALDNARRFPVPLLLMHGTGDLITNWEASRDFAALVPEQCTFKPWEKLYHELHHEQEWPEIQDFMLNWLQKLPRKLK